MKKLLTLTSIASAIAALALISACQTTGTSAGEASKKEALLSQSGFRVITVTDPKQQQAVTGLADNRVSAVTYNGKLYYVFPTAQNDRLYVGRQKQYNAYKQALVAQQGQQQMAGQSLYPTLETAGPNHIEVQQFGGFGPMGVNALGNW
jgi:ABC-type Fe3+-hydroxamate transport system substrate-binding protein